MGHTRRCPHCNNVVHSTEANDPCPLCGTTLELTPLPTKGLPRQTIYPEAQCQHKTPKAFVGGR